MSYILIWTHNRLTPSSLRCVRLNFSVNYSTFRSVKSCTLTLPEKQFENMHSCLHMSQRTFTSSDCLCWERRNSSCVVIGKWGKLSVKVLLLCSLQQFQHFNTGTVYFFSIWCCIVKIYNPTIWNHPEEVSRFLPHVPSGSFSLPLSHLACLLGAKIHLRISVKLICVVKNTI